jgi:hypothetical protein
MWGSKLWVQPTLENIGTASRPGRSPLASTIHSNMLSRFASKQAGGAGSVRSFSKMLVATEAFPIEGAMTPQKSVAPVISETKLANGIKLITKDYNANMVSLKFSIMGGGGAETEAQKGSAQDWL